MSLDLTSFVDFIDRFADIWHFISVLVFMSTRWDIENNIFTCFNRARIPGNVVGVAGKHSPVMQASVRRRGADNRETEPPRSEWRWKKENLTTTSLMEWRRQVECLSTLLIKMVHDVKNAQRNTKKDRELVFVLFFFWWFPFLLRPLFTAGGMRSLDHVGSFYPQRKNQLFIAAASGWVAPAEASRRDLKGKARAAAVIDSAADQLEARYAFAYFLKTTPTFKRPGRFICSGDERGSVHGAPSYWEVRFEFIQKHIKHYNRRFLLRWHVARLLGLQWKASAEGGRWLPKAPQGASQVRVTLNHGRGGK